MNKTIYDIIVGQLLADAHAEKLVVHPILDYLDHLERSIKIMLFL
jgi:hypothetical protein